MENIQNPDSYFDYILREKKAAMRLADYKETGVWNEDSVYDDVDLTENEVNKFGDIYRSDFFPKKSQKGEIVTMTFDLALDTNRTPIVSNASMFSSLMCDGNDLLDSAKTFEVINTKKYINYITKEIGSLTVKLSRPLTENNYYALVINLPVYNEVMISYARCTEENMSYDFAKIDDTTYNCAFASYLNEAIKYGGGQVSIIFFDTINGLPEDYEDYGEFYDFELFNSNINNIISTRLKCQTQIFLPSSEGIYVVEGELKEGVTSIGDYTFGGCVSLTNITFVDDSQLTSIGDYAFDNCPSLTNIEIPSSVTSIGDSAFNSCSSLTSIEIPSSVTSIGDSAFNSCSSLTSITFGDDSQLTSIGEWTFIYCDNLTSIEIPSSVTSIGERAFYSCYNLTSVTFGKNSQLTSIGEEAFGGCTSLTSISIPSSVTSIGDNAFSGCGFTSIIFANDSQLTSIGDNAFSDCDFTSIEIPSGVTSIGQYTFARCYNLTSIEIPSSVTSIGVGAFNRCTSLTSIEIPSGVTSIGDYTFIYCTSLTSIEIPSGVTSIGNRAFEDCSGLTSITCHAITAPSVQSNTFNRIASNGTLYYPKESDYSTWLTYLGEGWQGAIINERPL